MTELLPIVFARGQNESIDPRVAPTEVHSTVQNVRWRKDGRPAKKYGFTSFPTTNLGIGATFNTQPVNALTSWNRNPVIAIGSHVAQYSTTTGWNVQGANEEDEISHFGPGKRNIIARDERGGVKHQSCAVAGGLVLYAWDNGTNSYYTVKDANGATVVSPRLLIANGTWPRCISTTSYIYIITKNGVALDARVFDPTNLVVSAGPSPGNLDAAGSHFDAFGRSGDYVVAYQSGANVITVKSFAALLVPVLSQTRTTFAVATGAWLGINGTNTSNIFVCVVSVPTGTVGFDVFNNALTATLGGVAIEVDANNNGMPGVAIESNTIAQFVWCGFTAAANSMSYTRSARVTAGAVLGTIATYPGVAPASKPFPGPVYSSVSTDGVYLWVATHNADNGNTAWDSQRAYSLVKCRATSGEPLRRQMHAPSVTPDVACQQHLGDVLALGTGYGFLVPLLNAVRFTSGAVTSLSGLDSISARSIFESVRMGARDTAVAGRALQFSGGSLFELNGAAEETGFTNAPVIVGFALAGGGALTPGSSYLYQACYEWLDNQGRRHRSAPSDPVTVSNGANTQVTLTLATMVADARTLAASGSAAGRGTVIHVYRTLAGQSTFHRVTPDSGAPQASVPGTATVTFVDGMSDASAAPREIIYTDGGVLPNTLCPPHTFFTVCNGRLWVAGQLDACMLTASKLLVDGEPTQFSELESFSVFLPEECTGIASIDGTVVAFARERIYFVTGDGPTDQGIGSFNPPTELPTDVGCVDWRSVVETSVGVFFLAKRGIFLLPRGFNTPVFIGAEVEDTLATYPYIVDATFVSTQSSSTNLGELTVRFVMSAQQDTPTSTVTLIYDLRTNGWSVDTGSAGVPVIRSGVWNDSYIVAQTLGAVSLYSETPGTFAGTDGNGILSRIGTGDIRPFGVAGFGDFKSVVLVGEFRALCVVNVAVSVDGVASDTFAFTVSAADAADGSVYLDVTPRIARGSAIRITCNDQGSPAPNLVTEGFVMQALLIEHQAIGGTKRLGAARRA